MRLGNALVLGMGTAASVAAGCDSTDLAQAPSVVGPRILAVAVARNPNNVLSAFVTFRAEQADSARVLFAGRNLPFDSTPYFKVHPGTDTIPVLGLRPSATYHQVVQVVGPNGTTSSDTLFYTTSALPELLQHLAITTTGAGAPGLTLTSAQVGGHTIVVFAFDSAGMIRMYREFAGDESVS